MSNVMHHPRYSMMRGPKEECTRKRSLRFKVTAETQARIFELFFTTSITRMISESGPELAGSLKVVRPGIKVLDTQVRS